MKLTKANVDRLKLSSSKKEIIVFDETLPGFGLHIRGGGKRSWVAQYRLGSKQRRVTLGTVETLDRTKRVRGPRARSQRSILGVDPQLEKAQGKTQAAVTSAIPVCAAHLSLKSGACGRASL